MAQLDRSAVSTTCEAWLGIDIGTLSAKAALIDSRGESIAVGRAGYALESQAPGWAETPPQAWWEAAASATRQALDAAESDRNTRVVALGLSGQMHGVVLCRADGEPVRNAVTWADSRAATELDAYESLGDEMLRGLANAPAPGLAGPILLWLQRRERDLTGSARWALQPKDWLRLRLTGEAAAEPSDASATLLFHVEQDRWYQEAAESLGIDTGLLAPLVASDSVAGRLLPGAAAEFGLPAGLPVVAGAADTAASAVGNELAPGDVHLTIGSGAQLAALLPEYAPPAAGADVFRTAAPRGWYHLLPIHNAGIALEWALKTLGLSWAEAYALASTVAPGAEGLRFAPLLSSERAVERGPAGRGAWTGIGLHHQHAHLIRAALEGVAELIGTGLRQLEAAGLARGRLVLGGGGTGEALWGEMLTASLGRQPTLAPRPAASARGAAVLAQRATHSGRSGG